MPTYITLLHFTQKGIETIKEGPALVVEPGLPADTPVVAGSSKVLSYSVPESPWAHREPTRYRGRLDSLRAIADKLEADYCHFSKAFPQGILKTIPPP